MGSLPDSKYIIQTDGYWFVEAHDVDSSKGYITVSAKGIANGLSSIPNDGADFGPDSYDPTSSASIPYTSTSGIQEAINYTFNLNGGKIYLLSGIYNLTGGFHGTSIPGENGQFLIYFPYNSRYNPTISIEIEGEVSMMPMPADGNDTQATTSGVIIYNKSNVSSIQPGSAPYSSVMGGGIGSVVNYISVVLKNFIIRQPYSPATTPHNNQVGGINLQSVGSFQLENIRVDVDATFNSGAPFSAPIPDPSTVQNATGIATSQQNLGNSILDNVTVIGYGTGISAAGQFEATKLNVMYCKYAINLLSSNHIKKIAYLNTNNCPNIFALFQGSDSSYSDLYLSFDVLDIQNNNVANDWILTSTHIVNNNLSGKLYGHILNVRTAPPDTGEALILSGVSTLIGTLAIHYADQTIPSITTPSVPASGTAQQNTNPYPVNVYIYGGDVTEIQITRNGTAYTVLSVSTAIAMSGQVYRLNPGDSITLTYSTAPSWEWLAE